MKARSKCFSSGLFCAFKPRGPSSTTIVNKIKSSLQKPLKVGHGGTLDPEAEGVLVIGLGNACKLLHKPILHQSKTYRAQGKFGVATDTMDVAGKATEEKPYDHIRVDRLKECLEVLLGKSNQTPPIYSAVKVDGIRLYKLARQGKMEPQIIYKKSKEIQIFRSQLLNFHPPYFEIEIECSRGTYIRPIIDGLGRSLGSVAVVTSLLRTRQGPFALEDCVVPDHNLHFNPVEIKAALKKWQHLLMPADITTTTTGMDLALD